LPKGITRTVDKMLRHWRFLRFSSCGAFADALEAAAMKAGLLASYGEVGAFVVGASQRRARR